MSLYRRFQCSRADEAEYISAKKAEITRSNLMLFKRMLIVYIVTVPGIRYILSFRFESNRLPLYLVSAAAMVLHIDLTLWVFMYSKRHTMTYRMVQNAITFFGFTLVVYATLIDLYIMRGTDFAIFPPILVMLSLVYIFPKKQLHSRIVIYSAAYLALSAVYGTGKSFATVLFLVLISAIISFIIVESVGKARLENYFGERLLVMKEKRYRQALRMSLVEIWEYDYGTDDMSCCVDYSITGFYHWKGIPQFLTEHRLFREDHNTAVCEFLYGMKRGESCAKPLIAPIHRPDGTHTWINAVYNIVRDGNGEPNTALFSIEDINEVKNREIELSKRAERDSMTNLLNRGTFTKLVDEALSAGGQSAADSMLIIIDIDKLKDINDSNGHAAGDYVIMKIAASMREYYGKEQLLGRLGGDEFGVFVRKIENREAATERAHALCQRLSDFSGSGHDFPASCSLGAAFSSECGSTFYEMYLCADSALYKSKKNGKNQFTVYLPAEKR